MRYLVTLYISNTTGKPEGVPVFPVLSHIGRADGLNVLLANLNSALKSMPWILFVSVLEQSGSSKTFFSDAPVLFRNPFYDPGALKKARIGMTAEREEFEMEEPDDGNASPSVHSGGVLAAADLMERLVEDIAAGADMETVVDKYVKCKTPELRQQLIDGLRRMVGDRMISQSLREGRCEP